VYLRELGSVSNKQAKELFEQNNRTEIEWSGSFSSEPFNWQNSAHFLRDVIL